MTVAAGSRPHGHHITFGETSVDNRVEKALALKLWEAPAIPSPRSIDIHIKTETSPTVPQEHRPPIEEYGDQWEWDPSAQDYVRLGKDGERLLYTDYQRPADKPPPPATPEADNYTCAPEIKGHAPTRRSTAEMGPESVPRTIAPPVQERPPYEEPLDAGFKVVAKPKRFFAVGRIFKTVWFEPGGVDVPRMRPDLEQWSDKSLPFHGEKPIARFRWFIVVRRRLHHSLCFSITTFGGKGASKTSRGRPMDYVVLHSSEVSPARPYDEEQITRDSIAMIIEDEKQYISPIARLDCGRIYTVEDSLRVMKVGRVHPKHLPRLEEYYTESVA